MLPVVGGATRGVGTGLELSIILPASARAEVEASGVNFGCRNLIRRHPERIHTVEAMNVAVLTDVDTPEVYEELLTRSAPSAHTHTHTHIEQQRALL